MKRRATDFMPHLERYVFAMRPCQGRKTIELGGKSGYGADILRYTSGPVTVVDNVAVQLKKVRGHETILMDLNDEYPEGMWEAAVAFEIIEHVKDPDNFVKNITEHLEPGGVLVFSVPHMMPHIDHLTLFNMRKIVELVSKYLTIEELHFQETYGIWGEPFTKYPKTYVGTARK